MAWYHISIAAGTDRLLLIYMYSLRVCVCVLPRTGTWLPSTGLWLHYSPDGRPCMGIKPITTMRSVSFGPHTQVHLCSHVNMCIYIYIYILFIYIYIYIYIIY